MECLDMTIKINCGNKKAAHKAQPRKKLEARKLFSRLIHANFTDLKTSTEKNAGNIIVEFASSHQGKEYDRGH